MSRIWSCRSFPPPWNFSPPFQVPTLSKASHFYFLIAPSWVPLLIPRVCPQLLNVGVPRLLSSLAALISLMISSSPTAVNITYPLMNPKCCAWPRTHSWIPGPDVHGSDASIWMLNRHFQLNLSKARLFCLQSCWMPPPPTRRPQVPHLN